MAEKTAWAHVLGEPVVMSPGERPMKTYLDARFDGTMREFIEWMTATFKNPDDLHVRAVIGNAPIATAGEPVVHMVFSEQALKLSKLTLNRLSPEAAEDVVKKILKIAHAKESGKINAIKALREMTDVGLKDAKDFVEALPPAEDEEEEIPF